MQRALLVISFLVIVLQQVSAQGFPTEECRYCTLDNPGFDVDVWDGTVKLLPWDTTTTKCAMISIRCRRIRVFDGSTEIGSLFTRALFYCNSDGDRWIWTGGPNNMNHQPANAVRCED
ncbi:unnamed protein product, partial [Mesorhabditis belari]|uniref:Uncharacterized protein n=1 Tax=Mesorhabditis belari TaxID=2138241 RepID=A0AAF3EL76_9BILA